MIYTIMILSIYFYHNIFHRWYKIPGKGDCVANEMNVAITKRFRMACGSCAHPMNLVGIALIWMQHQQQRCLLAERQLRRCLFSFCFALASLFSSENQFWLRAFSALANHDASYLLGRCVSECMYYRAYMRCRLPKISTKRICSNTMCAKAARISK